MSGSFRKKSKQKSTRQQRAKRPMPVIGWREWVALPDLGIGQIKAKTDTGARSSSLHAVDVKVVEQNGRKLVRFRVHPLQRNSKTTVTCEAELVEFREIRSSMGHAQRRPVILTTIEVLGEKWQIELTLANRAEMGFRMLLGRESVRGRFLVDPAHSFVAGQPEAANLSPGSRQHGQK